MGICKSIPFPQETTTQDAGETVLSAGECAKACREGAKHIVCAYFAQGHDVHEILAYGANALHLASDSGQLLVVKWLVRHHPTLRVDCPVADSVLDVLGQDGCQ